MYTMVAFSPSKDSLSLDDMTIQVYDRDGNELYNAAGPHGTAATWVNRGRGKYWLKMPGITGYGDVMIFDTATGLPTPTDLYEGTFATDNGYLDEPFASLIQKVGNKVWMAGGVIMQQIVAYGIPDDCQVEIDGRNTYGRDLGWGSSNINTTDALLYKPTNTPFTTAYAENTEYNIGDGLVPIPPGYSVFFAISTGATPIRKGAYIAFQVRNAENTQVDNVIIYFPEIYANGGTQGWVRWDGPCYPMWTDSLGAANWQLLIEQDAASQTTLVDVHADLAALDDLIGTPMSANLPADQGSVSRDLTEMDADLGEPVGASLSADIAAIGTLGASIDPQDVRDAMALALTLGTTVQPDSIDDKLANLDVNIDSTGFATAAQMDELISDIEVFLTTGHAIITDPPTIPASRVLVSALFDSVRVVLRDINENQYKNNLMVEYYNRICDELNALLIQLGAEIAFGQTSIIGDGTNYTFQLPDDFVAFVPRNVRHRSPATATENYAHGQELAQINYFDPGRTEVPTSVTAPSQFVIVSDGTAQYIRFNSIPRSGEIIDAIYHRRAPSVALTGIDSTYTPWLGLLDNLIMRSLEQYCREGLEFTQEARMLWRQRAEADVAMILGLRHLNEQVINPSLFRGVPRR